MDSLYSLTNVAAAIGIFTVLRTIFFMFYRKFRSHRENKTIASSSRGPSSLPQNWKHDVFPSFHGSDVRKTFLSHILKEFARKGIDPFIDNAIERSKSIGPELIESIRGSRIAIVLLSKNYASSTWCLDELVEIIKCREVLGQTVMVLFYQVNPTDVKKQTGDFGKVFRKTCKGKTKDNIQRWKQALVLVAKIAGYHSKNCNNEAEMIEKIATDVSNKLNNSTPSSDFDCLVGMESHMINVGPLLRLDLKEVRMIGILGPSGIGKTTIARFLFNRYSKDFQLSVFMENTKTRYAVPACSDDYGVKLYLQEQFMSQIISQTGIKIPHLGTTKDRLKNKKVLAVLDDVDRLVQLEATTKEACWFGPSSRIIITTQDIKLLKASGINHIYKVAFPSSDEALQMFCMYAFGQNYPKHGFAELAWEVTTLAGKLPLGLRVMGSSFRGMSKQEWTKALPRLMTCLDGEIESILKFSYDALCDEDKSLFLHIACFFNDEFVDTVKAYLANSFLDVTLGLQILVEKSLISMDSERIEMHNLLVQLGREIVRKQSVSEPGKRQFLDDAKDIGEVFDDDNTDSGSVIGIDLMLPYENMKDIICTSKRAFERLHNLRFLRIHGDGTNVYFPQSLNLISRKLRLLSWTHFWMPCLPSDFHPKFLVKLCMQYSKLEKLWGGIQPLSNLKWMDLSFSESLKELPDLSTAINLSELNLNHCSSLVELPSSIGNAINLLNLDLRHCSSLVELPISIGNAIYLQKLDISYCSCLVKLPSTIGNAFNHPKLDLRYCSSLVELPSSIDNAINIIEYLNLSHCSSLVELPSSIGNAINLEYLDLSFCSSLVELPSSIGNAINLIYLNLSYCLSLVEIPSSIGSAINLQKLDLSYCASLVELPFSIGNAINLRFWNLSHCSSLEELPSSIGYAINLQKLDLSYCSTLMELPYTIGNALSLENLNLSHCSSLVELPSSIGYAFKLEYLDLSHCSSLVDLPSSMKNLGRLLKLNLEKCSELEDPLNNINLESLEEVNLSGTRIKEVPSWKKSSPRLYQLDRERQENNPWIRSISQPRRLVLSGMQKLLSLSQLPYSLSELDVENCESLERLDCSFCNPYIRLNFAKCFKLNQEARDLIVQRQTNRFAVLPGREVPVCFTYRACRSSLTVKLNQKPLRTLTRFRACILLGDKFGVMGEAYVYCSITSKDNALTACMTSTTKIGPVLPEHLYVFEVDAMEVTSTELVFEFKIRNNIYDEDREINECGIIQL